MSGDSRCILTAGDIQRALERMAAEIIERNRGVRDLALVAGRRSRRRRSRLRKLRTLIHVIKSVGIARPHVEPASTATRSRR